jgi:hypothetical protein
MAIIDDTMPILQYLKPQAVTITELLARYLDGGQHGWFVFISSLGTFAWWNDTLVTPEWQAISSYLFATVDPTTLNDGDCYVWNSSQQLFVITSADPWAVEEY